MKDYTVVVNKENESIDVITIERGPSGPRGEKGDKGDQGIQGIKGNTGDRGPQGIQGPKGDKGEQGIQGVRGITGERGVRGLKGDKGDRGYVGDRGPKGDKGDQGLKGDTGEQGIQGDKGDKGDQGEEGLSAYEVWLEEGNEGTIDDYLASIKGDPGEVKQEEFDGLEQDFNQHKEEYIEQRQQDQLKVAKVEKDINDYQQVMSQVNVNQEAKQKVTGYGVISLPKTAANGQVSASVKGRTLKNELNYNIDTFEEWDRANSELVYKGIRLNISGFRININCTSKSNTKYGLLLNIVENTMLGDSIYAAFGGKTFSPVELIKETSMGNIKGICVVDNPTNTSFEFDKNYAAGTGYLSLQHIRIFELPIGSEIETDFNTMTADQLAIKYPYIKGDDTKSTISASRLKSVGKNLFDGWELGALNTSTGKKIEMSTRIRSKNYSKVEPNTIYTTFHKSLLLLNDFRVFFYDSSKNYISNQWFTSGNAKTFTTPLNCAYVKLLDSARNDIMLKLQLEKGSVETPYEPYTESTSYLPNVGELRSLPNGVRDEIGVSGGKAELVKRVKEGIIGEDVNIIMFSRVEYEYVDCKRIFLNNSLQSKVSTKPLYLSIPNWDYVDFGSIDDINNIGRYTVSGGTGGSTALWFIFPKSTTDQQMIDELTGLELTYQLAEPITTPIEVSGTLLSNPSGTVYIENVVADAGIYTTKFDIKELQLPIKSIDKLIKYNFETGVQTVLDTTLAVINEDKKSFTHPNLTDKDMVFVDYYYDVESTLGETTIEYLDSRHTIKDSVNNKFYSWSIKSTNGVPTVELTEVL